MSTDEAPHPSATLSVCVGLAALIFSVAYFVSDLVELGQGGFSPAQLVLTYVAEAAIPVFVMGLYAVQLPRVGWLGLAGAIGYAYAFTYFTGTVLLALVQETRDWSALRDALGPWVDVHGALMVAAGLAFGLAVVRAGVFPRWTGIVLMVGVLMVALSSALPSGVQAASAGLRDLGFAGMGASLLLSHRRRLLAGVPSGGTLRIQVISTAPGAPGVERSPGPTAAGVLVNTRQGEAWRRSASYR
jgi:hypothetical protein